MNGTTYMIGAYVVGLTLLWGYGIALWVMSRSASQQRSRDV